MKSKYRIHNHQEAYMTEAYDRCSLSALKFSPVVEEEKTTAGNLDDVIVIYAAHEAYFEYEFESTGDIKHIPWFTAGIWQDLSLPKYTKGAKDSPVRFAIF